MQIRLPELPDTLFFDIHFGGSGEVLHFYFRNQDTAETFIACMNALGTYTASNGKNFEYIISEKKQKFQLINIHGSMRYRVKMHKEAYHLAVQNPMVSDVYFRDALTYDAIFALMIACSNIIAHQIKPLVDEIKSGESKVADNIAKILAISDQEISSEKKVRLIIEEIKQGTEGVGGFFRSSFRGETAKKFVEALEKINLLGQWHTQRKFAQQKYPLNGVGVSPQYLSTLPSFSTSTAMTQTNVPAAMINRSSVPSPVKPNFNTSSFSQVESDDVDEIAERLAKIQINNDSIVAAELNLNQLKKQYLEKEEIALGRCSVPEGGVEAAKNALIEIRKDIELELMHLNSSRDFLGKSKVDIFSILPEINNRPEVAPEYPVQLDSVQLNNKRKVLEEDIRKLEKDCNDYAPMARREESGDPVEAMEMISKAQTSILEKKAELQKIEQQLMSLSIQNFQPFWLHANSINSPSSVQNFVNPHTMPKPKQF